MHKSNYYFMNKKQRFELKTIITESTTITKIPFYKTVSFVKLLSYSKFLYIQKSGSLIMESQSRFDHNKGILNWLVKNSYLWNKRFRRKIYIKWKIIQY